MLKKRLILLIVLLAAAFAFLPAPSHPQAAQKKITFEQAYQNKEPILLKTITMPTWLDDGHYLVRERDEKTKAVRLMKVSAATGEKALFLDYEACRKDLPKGIEPDRTAASSPDYSTLIYDFQKDLYLYLPKTRQLRRLTATPGEEKNPRFSPDARFLAYTRDNNLFACALDSGLEYQLTSDGSDTIYNGWASWVYFEEILGRGSRYAAFWWSPDSRKIAFLRFDDSPVPVFHIVRSTGAHGELETQHYPKSGDPNPKVKLGIVTLPANTIVWADFDENADHYVAWPSWLPADGRLVAQWMNRGQDNIKIFDIDLKTGKKQEIYDEKQSAWVEFFEDLYFFKDGSGFLLRSDAESWRHLYYYDLGGKLKFQLTEGAWPVLEISLVDEKNKVVYFTAAKEKSTSIDLYRVGLDGRGAERLTREPGSHTVKVSPGGSYFLDLCSSAATPPRLDLYRTDGNLVRNIESSAMPALQEYTLAKKELFAIPTEDGVHLPAYWILPPDFDRNKKYPLILSIYGGPQDYGTVSDTYPRLSHLFLAQEGIIFMSADHRGSGHFGKKGATLMHRNLGKWEMHDLIEAVKWLRRQPFVDGSRIGITGGSYGGYVTCLALTYGANDFTHGVASSSVTDWRLYDTVYTERYMDTPAENEKGYEFGSVLTHAGKLKGRLLLLHGDMDDNVHMQNTVQLIDALMDQDKMFEYMVFPNQRHGFDGKKRDQSSRRTVDFWFRHLLDR